MAKIIIVEDDINLANINQQSFVYLIDIKGFLKLSDIECLSNVEGGLS